MLEELRAAGTRIKSYDDWTREMFDLSDKALCRPPPARRLLREDGDFLPRPERSAGQASLPAFRGQSSWRRTASPRMTTT
jgi:hypothetical protein